MKLLNPKYQKTRRQILRNFSTEPERCLWAALKGRQFQGYKFRRQHGIGPYIVDFFCPELNLVIEIDGDSHFNDDTKEKDVIRDQLLLMNGIRVLRVTNIDVMKNRHSVLKYLGNKLCEK